MTVTARASIWRHRKEKERTFVCKNILIKYLCNIYCVGETTPFVWPAKQKRFKFATVVEPTFLFWGVEFCQHLQQFLGKKNRWKDQLPSRYGSCFYMVSGKKKISLYSLVVSMAQAVTNVSHSVFLFPHLVLSSLSVLCVSPPARSAPG